MTWFESIDTAAFRFANLRMSNPVCDWLMPFASSNDFFYPVVTVLCGLLVWKGGLRGRVCVALLLAIVMVGDLGITNTVKRAVGRPRPFMVMDDARVMGRAQNVLAGRVEDEDAIAQPSRVNEGSAQNVHTPREGRRPNSMPSGHAANWFAATMVVFVFYRRSLRFMLPLAMLVGFSRIYNGVHYPSDVLAGAIVGSGYALGGVWSLNALWQWLGKKWFPLWWQQEPSLIDLGATSSVVHPRATSAAQSAVAVSLDQHRLRLGYMLVFGLLVARVVYVASDIIELSADEAYQWMWSKDPMLACFGKAPLIAYAQWMGTKVFGDTELGVRIFSPVLAAALSILLLRFMARETDARTGFWLVCLISATPLLAMGATLFTVDSLLVVFWMAAALAGWRAVQTESTLRDWLWVGVCMGLSFLSKYSGLLQLMCWVIFFALWPPARVQLRRPGFYCAVLVSGLFFLPVLIWNFQHDWITVSHVANDAQFDETSRPTLLHFADCFKFIGVEALLWNPFWFVAAAWAAIAFWRCDRNDARLIYFFSMGAPIFLIYLVYSLRRHILPDWIAPCVLPLLCVMAVFWHKRLPTQARLIKLFLVGGLGLGLPAVVFMHDTHLMRKVVGRNVVRHFIDKSFLDEHDPMRRVRGWKQMALEVDDARQHLAKEGRPVFIIGGHYGTTSLLNFYLPEARAGLPDRPLIYLCMLPEPKKQCHFWKRYSDRKGQNALYVQEDSKDRPPPHEILQQFESVELIGVREIKYRGRVFHRLRFFACRNLR